MGTPRHRKRVKTRKPHYCWGCNREFPAGTSLMASTCTDDGAIFTVYWCDVCEEVWDTGDYRYYDEINEGGMREDEYWEEARAIVEGAVS